MEIYHKNNTITKTGEHDVDQRSGMRPSFALYSFESIKRVFKKRKTVEQEIAV